MRITTLSAQTEIAGFLGRQSDVAKLISQHICGSSQNPPTQDRALATMLINECQATLGKRASWRHSFWQNPNERTKETEITVIRLTGNLRLIKITKGPEFRPSMLIEQELPEHRLVLEAAEAWLAAQDGFIGNEAIVARVINQALAQVVSTTARVAEEDLVRVFDWEEPENENTEGRLQLAVRDGALQLTVELMYGDSDELHIRLGNCLDVLSYDQLPAEQEMSVPPANEQALLPRFAKAVVDSLWQYYY